MAPAAHFRKRPQACVILSAMDIMQTFDNAPIGVFDSGFGGLTVAREIAKALPEESIIYVGDSARCPYGPRSLSEVDGFVQQIGSWLVQRGVKLIVIACNTATAAGFGSAAQQRFPFPSSGLSNLVHARLRTQRALSESGSSQRRPRLSRMPIRRRFATWMRESLCFSRLRRDSSR